MKYADLIKFKTGGHMHINERMLATARPGSEVQEAAIPAKFGDPGKAGSMMGEKILTVAPSSAGDAAWIPYHAKCSIYGYLDAGKTVAVSGPFSGCYFEVGVHGGRIYAAHVSCEGSTDQNAKDWLDGKGLTERTVLFRSKVGLSDTLPKGATNAAAIVFAQVDGNTVRATRVDVQTQSAGGMSGPIFDVKELVNQR